MTRVLFIGDVVGKPGRELVRRGVPALVAHHQVDLVVANGENAAAGFGLTPELADHLFSCGVDVITGGNHSWDKKEIVPYLADHPRLNAVLIDADEATGRATAIAPVHVSLADIDALAAAPAGAR